MKLKTFLLLLIINLAVNAQNRDLDQSIELPDFVITGVQSVDTPTLSKKKAEFIPVLDKIYFNPAYQPEDLNIGHIEVPFNDIPEVYTQFSPLNVFVKLGAGRYTMPRGNISLSKNFKSVLLSAGAWGNNLADYLPNSDFMEIGALTSSKFFLSNSSGFLPGLIINAEASFKNYKYKFFASGTPELERKRNMGGLTLGFDYNTNKAFNFVVTGIGNYLTLSDNNVKEMVIKTDALIKIVLPAMDVEVKGFYLQNEYEDDLSGKITENYLNAEGKASLISGRGIFLNAGLYYSQYDSETFVFPTVSASLKVNEFITLSASAGGGTEYFSAADLLSSNLYYKPGTMKSAYRQNTLNIKTSIKYEFDKYFQLEGGAGFASYDDYFFFEDRTTSGFFEVIKDYDVTRIFLYAKSYFHLGPMGSFYGSVDFLQSAFDDDKKVPYEPMISFNAEYEFMPASKFGVAIKYNMMYDIYTDRQNVTKLNDYQNLSVSLLYQLLENFEITLDLQNILNKDNFRWNGYAEKPFDIIAGFTYKW